jgi:hypothetical protein
MPSAPVSSTLPATSARACSRNESRWRAAPSPRNAGHRIGRDPGERASIEDVGADGNLEGQRRQSLQGCVEALRHRERRQFLDFNPAFLESAPEARRKAEDVKAREAEHHLPDGFCLQEKLER